MLPAQMLVEARLPSHALENPAAEAAGRVDAFLAGVDCRGRRVAVGAGSRGIACIAEVVGAVVATLKARGARPFIVPALGSHGGGTAEGQVELLDSFGISEKTMGAPLRPSMDVVEIGRTRAGEPVFTAREALEADGVVLVNRVKPHTDFESVRVGSGLVKMTAIGLGKVEGAAAAHRAARRHGYEESITAAARRPKTASSTMGVFLRMDEKKFRKCCSVSLYSRGTRYVSTSRGRSCAAVSGYFSRYVFMNCSWVAFGNVSIVKPGSAGRVCLVSDTSLDTVITPSLPTKRSPELSPPPSAKFTRSVRLKAGCRSVFG